MMLPLTCTAALAAFEQGTLTPSEYLEQCLAQIDRYESVVRAWVRIDRESARRIAAQRTDERRQGQVCGALHGVPLGIKDIIDIAGQPTEAGSPLRRGAVAAVDAPLVARLRAAGAVLLGKTVTTEFASFDPPITRNPWHGERTPGGSSSGSAASVAVGMCPAAIGTQTGGSIIRPASFCGVAGFKPAWATVPLAGIVPLSEHLDHPGPIARCVADLRRLHQVIADGELPECWPVEWRSAARQATDRFDDQRAPTIGVIEDFFLSEASADVQQATRAALERLALAGAKLVRIGLPASFALVHRQHRCLMAQGAAVAHGALYERHPTQFGHHIGELIGEGLRVTNSELAAALEHQRAFRLAMVALFDHCDVLATPATVTVAPQCDSTGDPRFNSPWSYCGLPTVSAPCGLGNQGLPVSLQLAGKPWLTEALFGAASWSERQLAFAELPTLLQSG